MDNNIEKTQFYSLENLKMLIIDDDEGLCGSLKFFFEDHECEVFTANDGSAGLKIFETEKPDIVIVDLNMPRLGGHNVVATISRDYPDVPIIVVSGTGVIKEAIRSIKLGAWDFVSKPILNFDELEFSVLKALEKSFLIKENKAYKESLERLVEERTNQLSKKSDELEALVEELKIAKDKAEETDKLKTEFLAQISHEIRSPLNVILSFLNYMNSESADGISVMLDDGLAAINIASQRLIRTIDLIVEMSELVIGSYSPSFRQLNLNDIINDVLIEQRSISRKKLESEFIADSEKIFVEADEHSVRQITANLLDNAFKFTEAGKITVEVSSGNGKVKVCIADTGVGIAESYLRKLFEPFSQEEQGYNRRYEGNGLGLAVTKKYCDLNNIHISFESKKDIGTKVFLEFNK